MKIMIESRGSKAHKSITLTTNNQLYYPKRNTFLTVNILSSMNTLICSIFLFINPINFKEIRMKQLFAGSGRTCLMLIILSLGSKVGFELNKSN